MSEYRSPDTEHYNNLHKKEYEPYTVKKRTSKVYFVLVRFLFEVI